MSILENHQGSHLGAGGLAILPLRQQKGVMCNPLHLKERNNSEIPDTIDINGENTIVRLKAKVVE